uniref:Importin N-terminal domain-containing protein n=1 Tax=Strombidium rassoulzadegani TaxID=1082188 RepID=A0A7S3FVR3_9SPIT|mmetsp:Transcript_5505/g.9344  ORF Transcript_5505/g.9344 Transcript_5505/m.9344 type:complete len:1104 (+) Transcript_5505:48-3359(+)
MTPEELSQLLQNLFQNNTQVIAEATATLKQYFKQVEALENLLLIMSQNPDQQLRQISCVYLRKIVCKLWPNLTKDQHNTTKNLLLERFKVEPVTLVKKNIAEVIGSLGKILIPNKEWTELFQFIFMSTQSEQLADKELAMILLSVIIEYFTHDEVEQYYGQLNPIIEGYLQSDVPSLKTLSIETVNKLTTTPKAIKTLKKYNNLIPLVLNALDLNNEDLIHKVFEVLNEFMEIKKVLGPHLPMIIEKAILISENKDYGVNLREVTILLLELTAEKYANVLIKKHGLTFIEKIVEVGFNIASEDPELYDENDERPPDMAVQMLYAYACNVPNEKIYPIFKKHLHKFGTSANEHERAGATYILGFICDSDACLDLIRDDVQPLTNFIVDRMQDDSYAVREAAGEAVGRFSEHVVPDFLEMHKKVLPCLLRVVKDLAVSKRDMTIQKALFALNEFVKDLEYDIKLYLGDIILLLQGYISQQSFSRDVRYWALFALASTIGVAQKKIIPFQQDLLKALHDIIMTEKSGSENQNVKGQALMCVGKLASSCGKENFPQEAISVFTEFAMSCLSSETSNKLELRETAFTYFSDLSVLIKEEIKPIVDQVLTQILKTCTQELEFKKVEEKGDEAKQKFSLDSDSEDQALMGIDVDVNQLDEKTAAVNALGIICLHSPESVEPRMQEIVNALEGLQFHFHENVKFHVSLAYMQIALGLMKKEGVINADDKFEWKKGTPAESPLPPKTTQYLNEIVIPYYFKLLEEEEDKTVIERVLENMREMNEDMGPAPFANFMDKLVQQLILFLDKKAFCQTKLKTGEEEEDLEDVEDGEEDGSDEEEDEEDDIDHDEIIFGNVSDIIYTLSRALGNSFAPYFNLIAPHLVVYTADNHPKSDRVMAMGCISEVFASCESIIPTYFADFLQLLEKSSGTNDSKFNRNVAYSIGVLAQHAQVLFQPHVASAVTLLGKLHQNSSEPEAQDNIVAASCRIVQYQYMPLPAADRPAEYQVMIDSVFQKIPFSGDETENETVLKFAFILYEADKETCVKYMEQIARTCVKVIADEKTADMMEPKFKKEVGQFINSAVVSHAAATLQELEGQMNQYEKEEMQKYLAK